MASQKAIIEDYQSQINQLNKNLAQATASISGFAQTRLLELKRDTEYSQIENPPSVPPNLKIEKLLTDDSLSKPKVSKSSKLKSIVGILIGIE